MLLSSLFRFYFVNGEKMGISYSPFPLNRENLFFFVSPRSSLLYKLISGLRPSLGKFHLKTMKFSEPNGSNYRGLESELFRNFDKSRL